MWARIPFVRRSLRRFDYNALNRVVEYTDRRGLVTQFDYDFWGRLVEETWLDGVTTLNVLEYRYDLANNLLEADDAFSAFDFTFDNLSRLLTSVDSSGGPTVRLSQTWDGNSNRAALGAEIDSGGGYAADFLSEYTFDNLSRLTRVEQTDSGAGGVDVSEKRVDFAYNAVNQFTTITRYEDLAATDLVATSTYVYDNAHRLTALTHAKGVTTLADYDWTYDVSSRVTSFTNNLYSSETATYAYDHTDQLTGADRTGGGNDEAYAFDENGNRTISGYVTGDGNLLTSDGTFDYEYDDENNRVRKENISTGDYVLYAWDHRNRLTAIEFRDDADDLQKRVEYDYDVFDRRIFKCVDDDGDGNIDRAYRYVYDHAGKFDSATGVPLDDIVLIFTDSDGEGEDDFELSNRLLHGAAVDQVLADEQFVAEVFDDIYWALPDNQGTIRDLVDYNPGNDTTTNAKHLAFASFGEITSDSSPFLDFLYAYTGREWDPDAELYFYRARWYDAVVGEFLSEDPSSFGAGDTNLGRYVGNGTPNAIDPSGLQDQDQDLKDILDELAGKSKGDDKPTVAGTPEIPWSLGSGETLSGRIVGIKDGKVTIAVDEDGKETTREIPLDQFSPEDQKLIEQLRLVPPNVVIQTPGSKPDEAKTFVKSVVGWIEYLSTLDKGKEILSGLTQVIYPPPRVERVGGKKVELEPLPGKLTQVIVSVRSNAGGSRRG